MNITHYKLDAGHGGKDSGALSKDKKVKESDLALKFALQVQEIVLPHLPKTSLTRSTDVFIPLSQRAEMANKDKAMLVSIHLNAGGGQGIEVFTTKGKTGSDKLATHVINEMDAVSDQPMRFDFRDGDPDKEQNFTVLVRAKYEAILIELGFMDNDKDLDYVMDPSNFERLCRGIARGLLRYAGLNSSLIGPVDGGIPLPVVETVSLQPTTVSFDRSKISESVENIQWQLNKIKNLLNNDA